MPRLRATKEVISSLAEICLVGDTQITLASGDGALFPDGSDGDYMLRLGTSGDYEIVRATARTGDVITITRACDDTTAIEHSAGTAVWTVVSHSYLDELWAALDLMMAAPSVPATHAITTANDKAETQVFEVAKSGTYRLWVYVTLRALITAAEGGTVTLILYNKINGNDYEEIARTAFIVGGDTTMPSFDVSAVTGYCKLTIQCSNDVSATRTIGYRYITQELE
jgi:hypothetical protein